MAAKRPNPIRISQPATVEWASCSLAAIQGGQSIIPAKPFGRGFSERRGIARPRKLRMKRHAIDVIRQVWGWQNA
jgi:hypothetical protein